MIADYIHPFTNMISENSLLSGIVSGIIVAIIIAIAAKVPSRFMNQFDKFDGIYEGSAQDLICGNSKLDPECDLDMIYTIRAKIDRSIRPQMNRSLSHYRIRAYVDIDKRPTKDFLGEAELKGTLKLSDSRAYMEYSLTGHLKLKSEYRPEPFEINHYGLKVHSLGCD